MFVFFGKRLVNRCHFEYNEHNYLTDYGIKEYILMNKKKIILLCVLSVLLIALIATGIILKVKHDREVEALRIYHETYLIMDGTEYLRSSTKLDLSGKQITELEKLTELTALKKLNMRNTGITIEEYEILRAGLPGCEILWSVPFQGGYCDDTITELTLDTISESDLDILRYFPALTSVNADLCRDYPMIFALMEQYPEMAVTYTVTIGEFTYPHTQSELTITDPDANELMTQLALLPNVSNVKLEGKLPDNEVLITLKEAYPNITFLWTFTVCGVETNTLAGFLDLSNIEMTNTSELEAALPCFYGLSKVDMINCKLSNEAMEALNNRHPETSFVWIVNVSGVNLRTDTKHFMPYHYGMKKVGNLYNLRYCTEIEVLDFGHKGVNNVDFIQYMPNLRYLLMLETTIVDLSAIGNCTSLEFLELASSPVWDFWPLTNLTNLKALNLSYTPYYGGEKYGAFGDITPLYQMTWLDRLWMTGSRQKEATREHLRNALPNVEVTFVAVSATDRGWRYQPGYYEMRDILEMWYMVH